MKNAYKTLVGFLRKYWYFLLLIAAGSLAISESIRITNKYHPSNWITGPSGFIMILGLVLVALLLFEILMTVLRAKKRAKKHAAEASVQETPSVDETAENAADDKDADERLYTRNMWLSFGLLIVYTLLIKVLGFALSSGLYLLVNLLLLKNSWKTTLITVVVILLFLLFAAPMLSMSFPRGVFGI